MSRPNQTAGRVVASLFDEQPEDLEAVQRFESLLLRDGSALREYVELADLDARLRWMQRGQAEGWSEHEPSIDAAPRQRREWPGSTGSSGKMGWARGVYNRLRWPASVVSALAASLLVVAGWSYMQYRGQAVGRLTEVAGVTWGDPSVELEEGSRLSVGPVDLLEGVIEITLRNDTRLVLEGPATLDVHSDSHAFLESGTVSVFVSDSVDNYVLESPDARVVDLGTAFQVTTSPVGTDLHVVDGQVLASAKVGLESDPKQHDARLTERESVRFNRRNGSVQKIAFAGGRMNMHAPDTPLTAIPIAVTGAVRCLELSPESVDRGVLQDLADNDSMHLILENSGCKVSNPIYADRNSKGETAKDLGGNLKLKIPTGVRVNSYLLHFDPKNKRKDYTLRRVSGTIEFRTQILGVFYSQSGLRASDRVFCSDTDEYISEMQSLGSRALEDLDFVSFSPDRRTLIVNLQANTGVDQLRIVTKEYDPQ